MAIDSAANVAHGLQLGHALAGVPYPARRWQLLSWSLHNGASHLVQGRLLDLPEKLYRGPSDVVAELRARSRPHSLPARPAPAASLIAASICA